MKDFATIELHSGTSPLVAAAIHHGHVLRKDLRELCVLHETERLREEDPFTGQWTSKKKSSICVTIAEKF